jgi:hypothetical protein
MRGKTALVLLALLFLAPASIPAPGGATPLEYKVKSAFLYHFTKFVEWPEDGGFEDPTLIRIGVLGNDRFADAVASAIAGKRVGNRSLSLSRFSDVDTLQPCHILFIDRSYSDSLEAVLEKMRHYPVMTVGDAPGMAERGAITNFYKSGKKIRFEINTVAADRAGLTISSKMLNLARIVGYGPDSVESRR